MHGQYVEDQQAKAHGCRVDGITVIVRLAETLIRALRRRDPLAERVVLSKPQVAACALSGVAGVLWRRLTGRRNTPAPAQTV